MGSRVPKGSRGVPLVECFDSGKKPCTKRQDVDLSLVTTCFDSDTGTEAAILISTDQPENEAKETMQRGAVINLEDLRVPVKTRRTRCWYTVSFSRDCRVPNAVRRA